MGRKTHVSIGRPLTGRHNIVVSRSKQQISGVQLCDSFMAALIAAAHKGQPVFVIGGAQLYRKALPIVAELHISWVKGDYRGDVLFPEFELSDWLCREEQDYPGFHYARYQRKTA